MNAQPNFIADHGALLLFPAAAVAVWVVLYLLWDGLRDWFKKRHIARLCQERRLASSFQGAIQEQSPRANTVTSEYFTTSCLRCEGQLVIPESLRGAEIACPQCQGMMNATDLKPLTFDRTARPRVLARQL
jgi:PHP family Zn ribbon phosphoesterase